MKARQIYLKRFEKQIILKNIGVAGQKKINLSSVLIIGMGGLGCPLLTYLAASGVGKIGIVDHDKVEFSNLNRQTLFKSSDVGKYKVNVARDAINKINNKIEIICFKIKVIKRDMEKILKDFDIVCDGTDNFETRYMINDVCLKNKKVLISSAISKYNGQLMKFDFKVKGPCYRCFMPDQPYESNNCQSDGLFSPVAGIMGSLQASEVLKTIIHKDDGLSGKILIFDALKTSFRKTKISINPKCINKC